MTVDYWYINLSVSSERRKAFDNKELPFKRWSGVNGNELQIKATKSSWHVENGKLGCYLSMLTFLMYAQEHIKTDRVLVVEDDAILPSNIKEFCEEHYPENWDMIYFYNFMEDHNKTFVRDILGKKLYKSDYPIGNVALLINMKSINKILNCLKVVEMHKDHQIATAIQNKKINAYSVLPNIVSLTSHKSTIC
jgi:GR25 family glycosyltransferase involved in LPS biosynthesis